MPKVSERNQKTFLKLMPFNFCDRFCERCSEIKNSCKIYQEEVRFKMQCLREKKDPEDPEVVFERIGKIFGETFAFLKENFEKEGIKIEKAEDGKFFEEEKKKDKKVKSHALYKNCNKVFRETSKFLENFNPATLSKPLPWATGFWKKEMEELYFYSPLIFVKTLGALHLEAENSEEEIMFSNSDYLISGALGYYSLLTVEKSLKNISELIAKDEPVWASKIKIILEKIAFTRKIFQETFSEVDKFKDRIIFHGSL